MTKTLHTGYTQDVTGQRTYYYVDNVDALSCEIREYKTMEFKDFLWASFLTLAMQKEESQGHYFIISVGDLYYETPEVT